MSKAQYLCAVSAGVLLAAALTAGHAAAQTRSAKDKSDTEVGEVVVTGSFIAGTPEDAAVPVEAVTLEELRNQGSPSNLDLVKTLSEIGSVAGEANRLNAFALGSQSVNLRGVSASRTVVVFNGRRFPEQYSASVGRFNNVALIPNAAIGRVEVLKDGGATTYGADAVGGVVNYITRKNLDGIETNANYRYINGSDGDYDADISLGKVHDNWNVMLVAGYMHRSDLQLTDRDWALNDYLINPSSWNGSGSPGAYTFQRAGQAAAITPTATLASGNRYGGDRQIGITGVMRDPFCSQVGGFSGWSATPSPLCYFQFGYNSKLVDVQNTYQGYAEANYKFDNGIKFHAEGLLYVLDIPHSQVDNGGALPGNFPIAPGSATGATQTIGTAAYAVPGSNPAVRALINAMVNSNGTPTFGDPNTAGTQAFQILNGGRVGLNTGAWRPFAYGGNPYPQGDKQHNYSTTWRVTAELSGDLPEFAGTSLRWSVAWTHNDIHYVIHDKDMLIDRLQAALNGLGGPGCTGSTPGAGGCLYFNPFSSAIAANVFTGQANPGFQSGLANSPELVKWLYVPLSLVRDQTYDIVDGLITGDTSLKLWADDPIAIAVGGQYRRIHEITNLDDLSDRAKNPCSTVGVTVCVARGGPLVFNRGIQVTGLTLDSNRKYPIGAAFFEVQAPIFNRLTANVSGRYEKFYSDVSDRDNHVFVPAGSLKWQVNDWLALRATGGKSFSQVNPPPDVGPTVAGNASPAAALGGTAIIYTSNNYPNLAVKPERGSNYNVGAVVSIGNFRANADYYSIKITNVIRAQTSAQIVNALVVPGSTGAGALINCASPLLTQPIDLFGGRPFVQLAGGANGSCVQGLTALNSPNGVNGGIVNFLGGQGTQPALANGGTLETAGIDLNASYLFEEVFDGQLTVTADLTHITKYKASDYVVAGITVAPGFKGIGQFNELTGRNGQHIAENRGSITFNYRHGRHNLNVSTRVVSSFIDDDTTNYIESNANNANIGTNGVVPTGAACIDTNPISPPVPTGAGTGQFGANTGTNGGFCAGQNTTILAGQKVDTTFNTDVSYSVQLPWDTTLAVTIQNLFNTDPEFSRDAINYDAFTGSPLGRTVRVGVRKRW
jgi:iron complex outermembrane receptor protein